MLCRLSSAACHHLPHGRRTGIAAPTACAFNTRDFCGKRRAMMAQACVLRLQSY